MTRDQRSRKGATTREENHHEAGLGLQTRSRQVTQPQALHGSTPRSTAGIRHQSPTVRFLCNILMHGELMLHKGLWNNLCQQHRWMDGRRRRDLEQINDAPVIDTNMSLEQACRTPHKATPDDRSSSACRAESQLAASQPWPTNDEKCLFSTHSKQPSQPRRPVEDRMDCGFEKDESHALVERLWYRG